MTDLVLARTNDIRIHNGDLALTQTNSQSVAQAIRVQLKTLQGEWFLDTQVGIPYFSQILGHRSSVPAVLALFREAIVAVTGVKEVPDIEVNFDSAKRAVELNFDAVLDDGTTLREDHSFGVGHI